MTSDCCHSHSAAEFDRHSPLGWIPPVRLVCKLNHCLDRDCPGHATTKSPEQDDDAIKLSGDAIAKYIQRYRVMLAARQQDPEALRRQYESIDEIVLSIDGLQPEKGREMPN